MIFVGSRTRTCKSKRNASGGHECVTPYTEPSLTFAADIWGRIARLKWRNIAEPQLWQMRW